MKLLSGPNNEVKLIGNNNLLEEHVVEPGVIVDKHVEAVRVPPPLLDDHVARVVRVLHVLLQRSHQVLPRVG